MYLLLIHQPVFSTISQYITRYPVHNFADQYIADIRYLKHCLRVLTNACLALVIVTHYNAFYNALFWTFRFMLILLLKKATKKRFIDSQSRNYACWIPLDSHNKDSILYWITELYKSNIEQAHYFSSHSFAIKR